VKSAASGNVRPVEGYGLLRKGIVPRQDATPAFEERSDGDAVENARRGEATTRVFLRLTLDGDDRGTDSVAHGALGDVLADDVELVRRREIVQ
jgi:hypothetical protein